MASTVEKLSPELAKNVPKHVAIIMDGNNRWAKKQGILKAAAGHKAGVEAIRGVLNACDKFDVDILTLFAFSSENWLRPKHEVSALMSLFSTYLKKEAPRLHENNIRLRVIGRRDRFTDKLRQQIVQAEQMTVSNSGRTLVIAADYGGKWDIAEAAKSLAKEVADGQLSADDIDEQRLAERMSLSDQVAPDLLIRTGGEMRISNYLLWQCAYSEFYFTETYWPDFGEHELQQAISEYAGRQRRFGKTSEQVKQEDACLSNV
jgi:undecaprenyl diphosphate synthase